AGRGAAPSASAPPALARPPPRCAGQSDGGPDPRGGRAAAGSGTMRRALVPLSDGPARGFPRRPGPLRGTAPRVPRRGTNPGFAVPRARAAGSERSTPDGARAIPAGAARTVVLARRDPGRPQGNRAGERVAGKGRTGRPAQRGTLAA